MLVVVYCYAFWSRYDERMHNFCVLLSLLILLVSNAPEDTLELLRQIWLPLNKKSSCKEKEIECITLSEV